MAYVSVDSAIPQNGRMAPPAACVDASNAAIELARCISRAGRLRAYSTVPTIESLHEVAPNLGASGQLVIEQSELARRSVLTGDMPGPSTLAVARPVRRPRVVPLNWTLQDDVARCVPAQARPAQPQNIPQAVVMPARLNSTYRLGRRRGGSASGVAGYSAPWGDASLRPAAGSVLPPDAAAGGILGWIRSHPWLFFGLVGAGVLVGSQVGENRR